MGDFLVMTLVQVKDLARNDSGQLIEAPVNSIGFAKFRDEFAKGHFGNSVGPLDVRGQHGLVLVFAPAFRQHGRGVSVFGVIGLLAGCKYGKAPVDALRTASAMRVQLGHLPSVRATG